MFDGFVDEKTARRRGAQGRHILRSILEAGDTGMLDDPNSAPTFAPCSLFVLKVKCAQSSMIIQFHQMVHDRRLDQASPRCRRLDFEVKIIEGPWKKTVDNDVNT